MFYLCLFLIFVWYFAGYSIGYIEGDENGAQRACLTIEPETKAARILGRSQGWQQGYESAKRFYAEHCQSCLKRDHKTGRMMKK